jgi:hypothetical protein
MNRSVGLVVAIVLILLASALPSQAQGPAGDLDGIRANGRHTPSGEPFGGFGFEYVQTGPSSGYVLDRWWMATEASPARTMPSRIVTATAQPRAAQLPSPTRRSGGRRVFHRTASPVTYELPTGSLVWSGAGIVSPFTSAQRYESYESGYARSPYGSTDYGMAYKGYYWGY